MKDCAMKKQIVFLLPIFVFIACSDTEKMQNQIDDLTVQLANSYKPGFGEFMSNIQVHHAKLWFAGKNKNWELAAFEVHEIEESLEAIQKYQKERNESQAIAVINPSIDSVKIAIAQQNSILFVRSYTGLTNTCNTCHQAVQFGFNVVKIPDTPPYSNQEYSTRSK